MGLWALICVTFVVVTMVLLVVERDEHGRWPPQQESNGISEQNDFLSASSRTTAKLSRQGSFILHTWRHATLRFLSTLYATFLTFTCTKPLEPRTRIGKFVLMCYAFFVLVLTATYTANLAAFLSNDERGAQYSSVYEVMDDLESDEVICAPWAVHETLAAQVPGLEGKLWDPAAENLNEFRAMDEGLCKAAILADDDNDDIKSRSTRHCNKVPVGSNLAYVGLSIPVSKSIEYDVSILISKYLESGELHASLDRHKDEYLGTSSCALTRSDDETLSVRDMGGAFALLFFGLSIALWVSLLHDFTVVRTQSSRWFDSKSVVTEISTMQNSTQAQKSRSACSRNQQTSESVDEASFLGHLEIPLGKLGIKDEDYMSKFSAQLHFLNSVLQQ
eukprot:gene24033-29167_t